MIGATTWFFLKWTTYWMVKGLCARTSTHQGKTLRFCLMWRPRILAPNFCAGTVASLSAEASIVVDATDFTIANPRDWKGWAKFSQLVLESHVEKILGKLDRNTEGQNVLTFGRLLELLVCNVFDFSCEWMQLQDAAMTTTRRINTHILYFRFCEMNLIRWVS